MQKLSSKSTIDGLNRAKKPSDRTPKELHGVRLDWNPKFPPFFFLPEKELTAIISSPSSQRIRRKVDELNCSHLTASAKEARTKRQAGDQQHLCLLRCRFLPRSYINHGVCFLREIMVNVDRDFVGRMRKGLHPQMQWISYVTQSGRLINIMMTKVNHTGKVYHMRAKRQMAQSLGQIAKFKRRYEQEASEENQDK
ncbi:hypothetical protein D1007_49751 [Hordeum vulgare]|nr:hypothetical protein D1007_49751 [Hordeum vulgare]